MSLEDVYINYHELNVAPYSLNIVMELGITDLENIIENNNNKSLNFQNFIPILRDSIMGLISMHANNIVHRDIKPQNLM